MTALGVAIRGSHLAASVLLAGVFAALLLAGRPRTPTARAWDARLVRWSRALAAGVLVSGLASLGYQAALAEGRLAAAADPAAVAGVALRTQGGHVWLARHGLLLLLAVFVALRLRLDTRADWVAARGQSVLLGAGALALLALAGHAAAVDARPVLVAFMDAVHLAGTGAWLGALVPLALLFRAASEERGADARPDAVVAARRFSALALAAVLALAVTGVANTLAHVGSVAGLVGTRYGRLLLAKLAVIAVILVLGAVNRARLLPALSGDGATVGRPALRRLGAVMVAEAALGLVVLGLVAALGVSPPARHEQPDWPFGFRLSLVALEDSPDLRQRALAGSQVAVVGAVVLLAGLMSKARRLLLLGAGAGLVAGGAVVAWPALAIDAYLTTYYRPTVPYHATSIAEGERAYAELCIACHGPHGGGDGPAARALPVPPADLRAPHTGQHTAGDLYWWISHGIPRSGMPGFADRLTEEQRWDVVNFVRVLGAVPPALALGPAVEPGPPALVAPDFSFSVGPLPSRSLRDYRGRRHVLLVLYELPGSRARLARLAESYQLLTALGAEIVAVPRDADPEAIRRLGPEPPILFPVVTEGAAEILAAYGRLARTPHAEFLVDRQGYLRARFAGRAATEGSVEAVVAAIEALNAEVDTPPPADEHVH